MKYVRNIFVHDWNSIANLIYTKLKIVLSLSCRNQWEFSKGNIQTFGFIVTISVEYWWYPHVCTLRITDKSTNIFYKFAQLVG